MAAKEEPDRGEDVINDQHPVGTALGVAGGAVAGAALGSAAGPVGTVAGVVIGGVAGGLVGRGVADVANPERADGRHAVNHDGEDAYWRDAHLNEPYYNPERSYDDYAPAYRMGWESRAKYSAGTFAQYEPAFRNDWDTLRGGSRLEWDEARHAVRAGWDRVERSMPTDVNGNSR